MFFYSSENPLKMDTRLIRTLWYALSVSVSSRFHYLQLHEDRATNCLEGRHTSKTIIIRIKTNRQTNDKEKQVDKNLLLPATGMGFFVIFFLGVLLDLAAASSAYKRK